MVIAIDGPAGAGKSTVARAAAERLGFTYLDSGAMYRAVALRGGDPVAVARDGRLELGERITLDGEDVTERIREPWVSEAASRVASDPAVREALAAPQRRVLSGGGWGAAGPDPPRGRLGRRGPRHRHGGGARGGRQGLPHRLPRGARAPPRRGARHGPRGRAARAGHARRARPPPGALAARPRQ